MRAKIGKKKKKKNQLTEWSPKLKREVSKAESDFPQSLKGKVGGKGKNNVWEKKKVLAEPGKGRPDGTEEQMRLDA